MKLEIKWNVKKKKWKYRVVQPFILKHIPLGFKLVEDIKGNAFVSTLTSLLGASIVLECNDYDIQDNILHLY